MGFPCKFNKGVVFITRNWELVKVEGREKVNASKKSSSNEDLWQ